MKLQVRQRRCLHHALTVALVQSADARVHSGGALLLLSLAAPPAAHWCFLQLCWLPAAVARSAQR